MEKIAVLSDIHGNLEALKACLNDIDQRGITHLICLGDVVAKGVHPMECLNLLRERDAIMIRGNCERYFCDTYDYHDQNKRIQFNQSMIDKKTRDYLFSLPMCYERYVSGAYLRFVHASPQADNIYVGAASSQNQEWEMFLPTSNTSDKMADIVIFGHTHTPYMNKAYHHTLINTGSVGNSIDMYQDENRLGNHQLTAMAYYLVIEGNLDSDVVGPLSFNHIQIPYDIEKELSSKKPNPEKEGYQKELRYGIYRDLDKAKVQKK